MSSANPFRMECPKCASTNVDLEEDQRAYLGGGRHQVQLHCYTCGHLIYGEKRIQGECDRQYAVWEAANHDALAKQAAEPAPAPAKPQPAPAPSAAPSAAAPDPAAKPREATPAPDSGRKVRGRKTALKAAPPAQPNDDEDDGRPGRTTGEIDAQTGLEIIVPAYDPPLDKKGRPLNPCSWPPCARYARPNSKYCSRNCSNKNARARYARRNDP